VLNNSAAIDRQPGQVTLVPYQAVVLRRA